MLTLRSGWWFHLVSLGYWGQSESFTFRRGLSSQTKTEKKLLKYMWEWSKGDRWSTKTCKDLVRFTLSDQSWKTTWINIAGLPVWPASVWSLKFEEPKLKSMQIFWERLIIFNRRPWMFPVRLMCWIKHWSQTCRVTHWKQEDVWLKLPVTRWVFHRCVESTGPDRLAELFFFFLIS